MTGTIVKLRLGNNYDDNNLKDKAITTIRIGNRSDNEFDVVGELGKLGQKVEITAKVITE